MIYTVNLDKHDKAITSDSGAIITEQEQLPYRTLIDRIESAYDIHRHTYAYDILFMDGKQRRRTTVRNDNISTKKREGVRGYVDRMYQVQGSLF